MFLNFFFSLLVTAIIAFGTYFATKYFMNRPEIDMEIETEAATETHTNKYYF